MNDATGREWDLESMVGLRQSMNGAADPVDELVLKQNVARVLAPSFSGGSDERFAFLTALSLLPSRATEEQLDFLDGALDRYNLDCVQDSEAAFMFVDLIVDHWPEERSIKLISTVLEGSCSLLIERMLRHLSYMELRPTVHGSLSAIADRLLISNSARSRLVGRELAEIAEAQSGGVRVPRSFKLHD